MKGAHVHQQNPYEMGRQVLSSLFYLTKCHPDHTHLPVSIASNASELSGKIIRCSEVEELLEPYVSMGLVTKSTLGLHPAAYPGLEDISYAYFDSKEVTAYLANLKMEKRIRKAIGEV